MPSQDLVLNSLKGGQNDTDPPHMLADDQCVLAENVEFFYSTLGERRNGCGPLVITSSTFDTAANSIIVHLSQWFPTNDVLAPEFFGVSAVPGTSAVVAARTAGTWLPITPTDALTTSAPDIYNVATATVNGKLFVAYRSAQDRLHVREATSNNLIRTGLDEPPISPPAADTAGAGTFAGTRYYRARFIVMSGTTVVRRSEPSDSTTFVPSGTNIGATITKPTAIGEGETHWELEASTDDVLFYVLATTVVGTTTVEDTTVFAVGYSAGVLSHAIGAYLLQPSARFLAVDGDRLIGAGHWTDTTKQAQIWWSAVYNDPGAGNDERLPIVTTGDVEISNTTNLDNYDGGPITGIVTGDFGTWYGFKWEGIYKMVRTGDITRAYDVVTLSKRRGGIMGSIVRGIDENGAGCVYFLDPQFGPSRLGVSGLQTIVGLRDTWARINLQATAIVARAVFYPFKQQVHWWIAVDGSDTPNLKLVLQVSELKYVSGGTVGRGWSTATGRIAEAYSAAIFTEVVSIDNVVQLSERPFIGLTAPDYIQRCDTESTDAGHAYVATIRTRPYLVTGLLGRWGAMSAALLATANASSSVVVKLIRDFGLETKTITTSLAPEGSETQVIKFFDDLAMSEAHSIQVEFTDPSV